MKDLQTLNFDKIADAMTATGSIADIKLPEAGIHNIMDAADNAKQTAEEGNKVSEKFIQCEDGCGEFQVKGASGAIDTAGKGVNKSNTKMVSHEELQSNGKKK